MLDSERTNSWLQRARAEVTPDAHFGTESRKSITPFGVASSTIWCAWDVWLHHIDQPRRRIPDRRLHSTDLAPQSTTVR
jgi:hypothetical protein